MTVKKRKKKTPIKQPWSDLTSRAMRHAWQAPQQTPLPASLMTNDSGRAWRCTLRYYRDFLFLFPVFSGYASERLCKRLAKSRWWDETSLGWQLVRRVLRGHFYQVLFRREGLFLSKQTLFCYHDWINKLNLKVQRTFLVFYFVYTWRKFWIACKT